MTQQERETMLEKLIEEVKQLSREDKLKLLDYLNELKKEYADAQK